MRLIKKPLAAGLLIVLFLTGQAALLAHQAGHDFKTTDSYCITCLNSSISDGACLPVHLVIAAGYSDEPVVFRPAINLPAAERFSTEPRAPPSLS